MAQAKHIPNFPRYYFWDTRFDELNWTLAYRSVIERILERGDEEDWKELVRFYGLPKVVNAIRSEIPSLADYAIDKAASFFSIPKEEMKCYIRKQSRKTHWL